MPMLKRTENKLIILSTVLLIIGLLVPSTYAQTDKAKELYNEGLKAVKAGDLNQAIINYKAAIHEDETYADPCINLGAIYFERKEYADALDMFQKAIERDKTNSDAFANLGRVQYILKKYTEAEASFQSAISLKSDDAQLHEELGKVYFRKKKYADVITTLEKAHSLGGGNHLSWYMLGKGYQKTGAEGKAIKAFQKSVSLKPNYASAHFALGQIYLSQEKYGKAAKAFKATLKADSRKYHAGYNYAISVQSQDPENYTGNIKVWEEFVAKFKKNPKAKKLVAGAKETIKALKEAKEQADLQ